MGADDKKGGDKKLEGGAGAGKPERKCVVLIVDAAPGVTLSKAQVKGALDKVLGPNNGTEVISITRTRGDTNIN